MEAPDLVIFCDSCSGLEDKYRARIGLHSKATSTGGESSMTVIPIVCLKYVSELKSND